MGSTECRVLQRQYSTDKPLFPLKAVHSVQSLIACTVQFFLYFPYGSYGFYGSSDPDQYSYNSIPSMGRTHFTVLQYLYTTSISLLPLWAVQYVQNLSAS